MLNHGMLWTGVGFFGQLLFSGRLFVQWIASELAHDSVIPTSFWYLSIAGGLVLFAYAMFRRDPVFIVGQGLGVFIYARNIYLLHRAQHRTALQA
jgi:lipid-A-disaccharide synthase-like uncharacterized protein